MFVLEAKARIIPPKLGRNDDLGASPVPVGFDLDSLRAWLHVEMGTVDKPCGVSQDLSGPISLHAIVRKGICGTFQFGGLKTTHDQRLGGQRYASAWMQYSSEY